MAQVTVRSLLRRFRLAMALVAAGATLALSPASALDGELEYSVKAAYLLKFAKFIEWPAGSPGTSNSTFTICVLGKNPFGNSLARIVSGEVVNGRKVGVQVLDAEPPPGTCQMIFLGDPDGNAPGSPIIGALNRSAVTVSDGDAFVRNGGMIGFLIENHRVTFEINWRAAEAAGFKLSAGLLSVAKAVIR